MKGKYLQGNMRIVLTFANMHDNRPPTFKLESHQEALTSTYIL